MTKKDSEQEMGRVYSLTRRRQGLDPRIVADDGTEWGVTIPAEYAGWHSPADTEAIARRLLSAATRARRMGMPICPQCHRRGCRAVHVGQIWEKASYSSFRQPPGTRWVVVRQTKRTWRLERVDDRRSVIYCRDLTCGFRLVGWEGDAR